MSPPSPLVGEGGRGGEGESWVAIAVLDDRDWRALVTAMGSPDWAADPALDTLPGRIEREAEIEARLEEWTGQHNATWVMHTLQAAGVAAGVVQNARDIAHYPQLRHRGHTHTVDHRDIGPQLYDGPSYRLSKSPIRLGPAPAIGQHNDEVFQGMLGMSDAEYRSCWEDGVFE